MVPLAPLLPVEYGCEQTEKHLKQVKIMSDRLDIFRNKDADAKPFQYTASSQKKIPALLVKDFFKVVISKKVVTPNKVLSNT